MSGRAYQGSQQGNAQGAKKSDADQVSTNNDVIDAQADLVIKRVLSEASSSMNEKLTAMDASIGEIERNLQGADPNLSENILRLRELFIMTKNEYQNHPEDSGVLLRDMTEVGDVAKRIFDGAAQGTLVKAESKNLVALVQAALDQLQKH